MRSYVQRRRQQLGLENREVFAPQTYEWGSEARVDFHEPAPTQGVFAEPQFRVINSETHSPTSIRILFDHSMTACMRGFEELSWCCQLVQGLKGPQSTFSVTRTRC